MHTYHFLPQSSSTGTAPTSYGITCLLPSTMLPTYIISLFLPPLGDPTSSFSSACASLDTLGLESLPRKDQA